MLYIYMELTVTYRQQNQSRRNVYTIWHQVSSTADVVNLYDDNCCMTACTLVLYSGSCMLLYEVCTIHIIPTPSAPKYLQMKKGVCLWWEERCKGPVAIPIPTTKKLFCMVFFPPRSPQPQKNDTPETTTATSTDVRLESERTLTCRLPPIFPGPVRPLETSARRVRWCRRPLRPNPAPPSSPCWSAAGTLGFPPRLAANTITAARGFRLEG